MSLNDWQPVPLVATGDLWTAAEHNTYIRNNQQVLHDGLAAGHGSGSDADMVDGRHADGTTMPGVGIVDKVLSINIPNNTGYVWYTLGRLHYGTRLLQLLLVASGCCWTDTAKFVISASQSYDFVRYLEISPSVGYCCHQQLMGLRIVQDANDSHTGWLQVLIRNNYDDDQTRKLTVYMMRSVKNNEGAGFFIDDSEPPSDAIQKWAVAFNNGSWRLARALTGSGETVGWMSPADERATFSIEASDLFSASDRDALMDGDTGTTVRSLTASATKYVTFEAANSATLDAVRVYATYNSTRNSLKVTVYASNDNSNWTNLGNASGSYNPSSVTVTFAAHSAKYWKLVLEYHTGGSGSKIHYTEVAFRSAASLVLTGVPVGAAVQAVAADGTVLETVRNTSWTSNAPVMLATGVGQIDIIRITRPDGSTNWLQYPTWAIDGGALQNGDVLTLYSEA